MAYLSSSSWEFGNQVSLACFRLSAYFGPNPVCKAILYQYEDYTAGVLPSGVLLWLVRLLGHTSTAMRALTLCLPPSGCADILLRCSWLSGAPVLASQAASRSTKTHKSDDDILLWKLIDWDDFLYVSTCSYSTILASCLLAAERPSAALADVPEGAGRSRYRPRKP